MDNQDEWIVIKIDPKTQLPIVDTVGTRAACEERAAELQKVGRTVSYCGPRDEDSMYVGLLA